MAAQRQRLRSVCIWVAQFLTCALLALGQMNLTPTNINFGTLLPGQAGTPAVVTLTNPNAVNIHLTQVQIIAGADTQQAPTFSIQTNTCGATLLAGSNCTITLAMAASQAVGLMSANLQISSDDPINSPTLSLPVTAMVSPFTNLGVVAMNQNGSTWNVTVSWTSASPGTTSLVYGAGNLNNATPVTQALVTSHSVTLQGLKADGTVWWYAGVSNVAGAPQQSQTQKFEVCDQNQMVNLTGSVNNYFEYGSYSIAWQDRSGSGISPTLCGQAVTTLTGSLDRGSSFSTLIPNSLEVVPSPSNWTATVSGVNGYTSSVGANFIAVPPSTDIAPQLKAAAGGRLIHVWYDTTAGTFYPPTGGGGGGAISNQISGTVPLATSGIELHQPSHISEGGGVTTVSQPFSITSLTPGTAPVCPNGTTGALTTVGCVTGTAANPAGASGQSQMNAGGTFAPVMGSVSDPTYGWKTQGGFNYAKGFQSGAGMNGIAPATANGQTVIADPSYVVTATAVMTQGSTTVTVSNVTGGTIQVGQICTGNVNFFCTVSAVSGSTVTLASSALTTNAAAPMSFFEMPYRVSNFNVPPASQTMFLDSRLGLDLNLKRDPPSSPFSLHQDFNFEGCYTTKLQSWTTTTTTGGAGTNSACHYLNAWFGTPGSNYGATAGGHSPSSWSVTRLLTMADTVSTPGIGEMYGGTFAKTSIGDGPLSYTYYVDYLGAVAGADEGQGGPFWAGGEATTTYSGTVLTGGGGAGATSVSFVCTADCSLNPGPFAAGPGDGRFMIDKANPIAFNMISRTAPSAQIPGTITIDTAITPSTFWGTLAADVITPPGVNAAGIPFSNGTTDMVFNVNTATLNGAANAGNPQVGDLVCFSWPYHEQAKIKSVNSGSFPGPWNITVPLRMPHIATSWMFSNGPCGSYINFTANDSPATNGPAVVLHYPFEALGATTANTLAYVFYNVGAVNVGLPVAFGLGNIILAPFGNSTATNSGGVVTLAPGILYGNQPYYFYQPVVSFTGAADPAYNGPCYNTRPNATGNLVCDQASSLSHGPTTTVGVSVGPTGYGNTDGFLFKGAEVLDILDYNQANCAATTSKNAPCFDNKNITLEPNNAAWTNAATTASMTAGSPNITVTSATGVTPGQIMTGNVPANTTVLSVAGTAVTLSANATANQGAQTVTFVDPIEESHHYSSLLKGEKNTFQQFDPYFGSSYAFGFTVAGTGVAGGNNSIVSGNYSAMYIGNANPVSMYQGHGGTASAPGGINLYGASGYNYGVAMATAPEPAVTGTAVWVGCPADPIGCTDRNYTYGLMEMAGLSSGSNANSISYSPFNNEIKFGNGTNPIVWAGEMNGLTMRDNIKFAAMTQPVLTLTQVMSSGAMADGGSYCYYIIASNVATKTPIPTETCLTIAPLNVTGKITTGSTTVTSITPSTNLVNTVGAIITGTGIPVGTTVVSVTGATLVMSAAATASTTGLAITIDNSSSNSIALTWTRISSATSYYVCGRFTGAEGQLLPLPISGVDSTYFIDTGGNAVGASCSLATIAANGSIDQAGQVGINSLGTIFENIIKGPGVLTTGTTTAGSPIVVVASNNSLAPGFSVTGVGIPGGTTVITIAGTSITLSNNATVTSATAVPLTFGGLTANVTDTLPPGNGTLALGITNPNGPVTFTATSGGGGSLTCACAAGYTCTNARGRITIFGGTVTTGNLCQVNFNGSLGLTPFFFVNEAGATTPHGLDHSVPVGATVTITAAVSVSGATLTVDYITLP